jgi:uncharacterized protein YggE
MSQTCAALVTLALAALTMSGCAATGAPTRAEPRVIVVTARGEATAKPDTAILELGAESRRPSLVDATTEVARRMGQVLERLGALGVPPTDVTTIQYSVQPIVSRPSQRPDDGPPEVAGYHVSNVVRIRVTDLAAVGRLVETAMAGGANVIRGIHFVLVDRRGAERMARERAVESAHAAATDLARAAHVRLGPMLTLVEGGAVHPAGPSVAVLRSTAPGPIETGELTVSVVVEARYEIGVDGERRGEEYQRRR